MLVELTVAEVAICCREVIALGQYVCCRIELDQGTQVVHTSLCRRSIEFAIGGLDETGVWFSTAGCIQVQYFDQCIIRNVV